MKRIEILGPGCSRCNKLEEETRAAAYELGLECQIEKVTDIQKITFYGVMMTPALVVDGHVKISGRVPSKDTIKKMLI
jgi:small redox-active disulfide protein 2